MKKTTRCLCTLSPLVLVGLMAVALGCAQSVSAGDGDGGTGNNNTVNNDGGTGDGGIGTHCGSSEDCDTGLCLVVGGEFLCSRDCSTDPCPDGTYCAHVDPQSAPPGETAPPAGFYCLPDRGGLCKPCGSDINCSFVGDQCLDLGGGVKVCGRDCSFDQTCPAGYECVANQCWPIGNTCDCTEQRVGATQRCEITNQFGTCYGTETCYIGGWEGCDSREPGPEVCNGIDDDCDGNLPGDELDNNGNGVPDCMDDCTPEPEVCDLQDNDCNQVVDDGDPVDMCGAVAMGTPACVNGQCVVASCSQGYVDLDQDFANGCECQVAVSGGADCAGAEDLASLDDTGQSVTRSGVLLQNQEVWYRVTTVDLPDGVGGPTCDGYHFRVQFLTNPDNAYRFDVVETDCSQTPVCPQSLTDFQYYANFRSGSGDQAIGECECAQDPANVDGDGRNQCSDQSTVYFIRVFREDTVPVTCSAFEIEFSNGVYTPP